MADSNDIVKIHIDGIHARQSRIFGVVSVPRSSVVPTIAPQCIELIYKHLFNSLLHFFSCLIIPAADVL